MLEIKINRICGIALGTTVMLLGAFVSNGWAQQVTTPNGSRTMVQKGVNAPYSASTGSGVEVDINYNVSWEAKVCEQVEPYGRRPQAVAWVTNYVFDGVEYRDEYFSADEIGQNTLKQGLEIVNLNSGIVAEVKSLESGESDEVGILNGWILAEPQKRDVCDMDAAVISHHELSRGEYTVQIKNTDHERKNRIKITKDLHETIAYKAIDSKMEKAKVAANGGDKNSAQQIAMKARSMCPGGTGTFGPDMGRNPGDPPTECEIEISEFLQKLSDSMSDNREINRSQENADNNSLAKQESSNSYSVGERNTNSNNGSDNEGGKVHSQQNTTENKRDINRQYEIDEHNAEILQRAQTITDQAEKLMWGEESNSQFKKLEGEIGTYNRMIGALEQRRMDNLNPKEKQELETYLLSMNAAKVLGTLAGGGNLLDSEASIEGAVEAGVNLLEARAERKAAEREAEEKRKEAIRKMEEERKERERELQRKREQEALNRMQHFSRNVLDPFDESIIGQPVNQNVKKVKSHYASSHESLQEGDLQRGIRHMKRALNNLKDKKSAEAGIIQYQLAWMYSENDDLITAVEYADAAPELTQDTSVEDVVEEFSNGIEQAYEKQERRDFLAQKRTGIPEKLENYLNKYPEGEYADEAENLIKEWRAERQRKMQSLRNSYRYHQEKAAKHGRNAGISGIVSLGAPIVGLLLFAEEDEDGQLQGPEWVGYVGLGTLFVGGTAALIFATKKGKHNQKASNIEKQMRELRKQKFSANIKFNSKYEIPLLSFRVNF